MPDFLLNVRAIGTEAFGKSAKETAEALNQMEPSAKRLGAYLSDLFKIGAIAAWAKETVRAAQALTDLSDRTGIARGELQALEHAANATDTPIDVLTGAFERLAKVQGDLRAGIGRGEGNLDAFKELGFSMRDLERLSPQQLFAAIADKAKQGALTTSEMSAGVRLLGEGFRDIIPAAKDGLGDLVKEFGSSWKEIDEGTIDVLDRMGSAFDAFWANVKAGAKKFSADLLSSVSVGATTIASYLVRGAGLFSPGAAAIAEEMDTQLELDRMGGDGSRETERLEGRKREAEKNRSSREQIETLKGLIRDALGDDADDVLEDLQGGRVDDYQRALRRARRQQAREGRRRSSDDSVTTPAADALRRIGGFNRAFGFIENQGKEQLKLTKQMASSLKVIEGEFTAEK
jgi:hypothetical protein